MELSKALLVFSAVALTGAAHAAYEFRVPVQTLKVAPDIVDCTLPWGGTLADGTALTAYAATSATYPESCVNKQVSLSCVRGELSATNIVPSCSTVQTVLDTGAYRAWSDGTYAPSCKGYAQGDSTHVYQGSTGDGLYRIDPDGAGAAAALDVYCDMTTDGGGWTLIVKAKGGSNAHANVGAVGSLTSPAQTTAAKLSDARINGIPKSMYRVSNSSGTFSVYFDTSDSFAATRQVANKASKTWQSPTWMGPYYDPNHRGLNSYQVNVGNFGKAGAPGANYTGGSSGDACRLGIGITGGSAGWCGAGDAGTVWLK